MGPTPCKMGQLTYSMGVEENSHPCIRGYHPKQGFLHEKIHMLNYNIMNNVALILYCIFFSSCRLKINVMKES